MLGKSLIEILKNSMGATARELKILHVLVLTIITRFLIRYQISCLTKLVHKFFCCLKYNDPISRNLFGREFEKTLKTVLYHFGAQESGANHYGNAVIVVVTQYTSYTPTKNHLPVYLFSL